MAIDAGSVARSIAELVRHGTEDLRRAVMQFEVTEAGQQQEEIIAKNRTTAIERITRAKQALETCRGAQAAAHEQRLTTEALQAYMQLSETSLAVLAVFEETAALGRDLLAALVQADTDGISGLSAKASIPGATTAAMLAAAQAIMAADDAIVALNDAVKSGNSANDAAVFGPSSDEEGLLKTQIILTAAERAVAKTKQALTAASADLDHWQETLAAANPSKAAGYVQVLGTADCPPAWHESNILPDSDDQ